MVLGFQRCFTCHWGLRRAWSRDPVSHVQVYPCSQWPRYPGWQSEFAPAPHQQEAGIDGQLGTAEVVPSSGPQTFTDLVHSLTTSSSPIYTGGRAMNSPSLLLCNTSAPEQPAEVVAFRNTLAALELTASWWSTYTASQPNSPSDNTTMSGQRGGTYPTAVSSRRYYGDGPVQLASQVIAAANPDPITDFPRDRIIIVS